MKNFPHQISNIPKIVTALNVFGNLYLSGADVSCDDEYGYALARAGVYTFRNIGRLSIEKRIIKERKKPHGKQGARTCARELRRFFTMLGAIEEVSENQYILTNIGFLLIAAGSRLDSKVKEIWSDCLRNITLIDDNGTSHPYSIMLKLINDFPGIERRKLALALEAEDNSDAEYQRISSYVSDDNWQDKLSASKNMISNAVKILPALALQVGDLETRDGLLYMVGAATKLPETKERVRVTTSRIVNSDNIASVPTFQDDETDIEPVMTNQTLANSLRRERTILHHRLVKRIAKLLEENDFTLSENPMDCLATKAGCDALLIEAKTISKNHEDEDRQVRLSLGQLTYYKAFYVNTKSPVKKIAIFDKPISREHAEYLEKFECFSLWIDDDVLSGTLNATRILKKAGVVYK